MEIRDWIHGQDDAEDKWSIFKTPKSGLQYIMPTRYEAHNKTDIVVHSNLSKSEAEALIKIINS